MTHPLEAAPSLRPRSLGGRVAADGRARPLGASGPAAGRRVVKIIAGEHCVSADPEEAIMTLLGSCIAACIHDPVAGIGGMNHFMLPSSESGTWGRAASSLRYGNFAMERLVNDILVRGGRRNRLEAKVFGGAQLFADHTGIGERNARFVEEYLATEGVRLIATDMLGTRARRLVYLPVTGQAWVAHLGSAPVDVVEAEQRYRSRLPRVPEGTIELFD